MQNPLRRLKGSGIFRKGKRFPAGLPSRRAEFHRRAFVAQFTAGRRGGGPLLDRRRFDGRLRSLREARLAGLAEGLFLSLSFSRAVGESQACRFGFRGRKR
jgi:hypothetical protein